MEFVGSNSKLESFDSSYEDFLEAVDLVTTVTNISSEEKLLLYGLYKQAQYGDESAPHPPVDPIERMKWEAWKALHGCSKEAAADAYVKKVKKLLEEVENVATEKNLIENNKFDSFAPTVSTFQDSIGVHENDWKSTEELCQAICATDTEKVEFCITNGADVNMITEDGLTPLHYAADLGDVNIVSILIREGCIINSIDNEGQTPLMLAAICDHEEVVKTLLESGADINIPNTEGKTIFELEDVSENIIAILKK